MVKISSPWLTLVASFLETPHIYINIYIYMKHVQHIEVNCVQLETKHASYSSFKIDVTGTRLTNFLDAKNWPAGAYVRRFFTVKN